MDARLGKLQAAETVWSVPFWIGSPVPRAFDLVARVSADNISVPIEVPFRVSIGIANGMLEPQERADEDDEADVVED